MTDNFQFHALAIYNSEVARGIVHTDEWKEHMEREQQRFNRTDRVTLERIAVEASSRRKRWWKAKKT